MTSDRDAAIVVLTALNLEYASVRRRLADLHRVDHPAGTVFETGRLPDSSQRIALAVTGPGNTAAAVVAERAIALFQPRALVFVGVAGALHDDLALGDVLVATKVYAYHGGQVKGGQFRPRPRSWEAPHQLDQIARQVHRDGTFRRMLGTEAEPSVHFGPLASGEVVVNGREHPISRELVAIYDDAAAIDMESAGTAQAASLRGVPVLIVRGISDHADGRKEEADRLGWQPVAAAHAATFALAVAAQLCRSLPAAPPGWTPPRQLPAGPGPLVGREQHLAWLDRVLLGPAGERPRLAVLTGMAGAGKTALAVAWAHRVVDRFPDGVIYADGRGFGPDSPLPPQALLAGILRAFGQEHGAERGSLDERAALLRTLLARRRVLLLLDNMSSADQVRPLLPGDTAVAVLVTSRQRLRGLGVRHGARVLEVAALSSEAAQSLLRLAIDADADIDSIAVRELADRCGRLPLALRIAAELVNTVPGRPVAQLAAQLAGPHALDLLDTGDDAHSAVRSVFSWSYHSLDAPVATAFRRLGLHPGKTFGLPAAAALIGSPLGPATLALRALVNAHLVAESAPGRYEMHDLLRDYARDLSGRVDDEAGRGDAVRRMAGQYLYSADQAGRMIMPHRHREPIGGEPTVVESYVDRAEALRWFAREQQNLVEICRLGDPDLDACRWRLAFTLRDYFYLTKHLDSWLETHELALAACQRLGDHRAEAMTRNNLGRARLEAGDLDAAASEYEQARRLFDAVGDAHGATDASVNLASVLRRQGRPGDALAHQLSALAFYERAGVTRKIGITLRSMARAELALGRLGPAAAHAERARTIFIELGLDMDVAETLTTLIRIQTGTGDYAGAEATGRTAVEYCRRAESAYEHARVLHALAGTATAAGDRVAAQARLREALAILDGLGAPLARAVGAELDTLRHR